MKVHTQLQKHSFSDSELRSDHLKKITMKTIRTIFFTLLITVPVFYACKKDYLNQPALGALSADVLANKNGVNALLIGAYGALDGQGGIGAGNGWESSPTNWIYGSVASGDASKGSYSGDQNAIDPIVNFYSDASNGFYNSKWKTTYEGISRSNAVLTVLAQVTDMTDAEKKNVQAQAQFLRAHYYFELKKMFNMVPYIDEKTTDFAQPNTTDIWPKIEADFKSAYDNLPETQPEVGRANKWAAGAYLAKTYLYEKKYAEAKTVFDAVITSGKTSNGLTYGLMDYFEDNFLPSAENNKESVFAIQMAKGVVPNNIDNANSGEMLNFPYNSPFGCCGFYQPTQELVNHYRTDDVTGLPSLDTYNSRPVKSDQGLEGASKGTTFVPESGTLDPRLDWTVGRRGIPFLDWGLHPGQDWVRDQAYGGAYAPKKNIYWKANEATDKDPGSWAPGTSINVLVIRYADVLLMAAEAEAQLNNLAKAQDYVNLVRTRAAKPNNIVYTYKDATKPADGFTTTPAANYKVSNYPAGAFAGGGKDFALKAIYFERKIELAMEGHRFFDLVRWGTAESELTRYFSYQSQITQDVKVGKFIKGKNEYYPIPQRQIDLSTVNGKPTLTQNPNYK
jgi:tetratricopeptide (TPR) repeat protein